ncbi:putative quinol monooxygenase [Zobellella aerophila]|uniref:Quinol monooxygenase n=1 Tax=Zobellella aerophila TaxID=870480 RepID=A0ABP6VMZ4_9GAMM
MGSELRMIVTLKISPEAVDNVRAAMQKLVPPTRAEAGCLQYDFFEVTPEGPGGVANTGGDFVVIEGWRDEAAHRSHVESDHFQAFITAFSADELQLSVQVLKNA